MRLRFAVTLFALASAATLRATVLAPADLNELAVAANAIVYARITDVRARESDDRARVDSIVTAEAVGYIKGNLGRSIVFRIPGGTVGAYKTLMVGAPSFSAGEEVVLFFVARPPALPYIAGFSQGVFRVRIDERTGARVVIPPPAISKGERVPLTRGTRLPMPLDEFSRQVQELLSTAPRGGR